MEKLSLRDLMAVLTLPEFELELDLSDHLAVYMEREGDSADSYLIFSSPKLADTYHACPFISGEFVPDDLQDIDTRHYFLELVTNMNTSGSQGLRAHCLSLVEYENQRDMMGKTNGDHVGRYFAWRMMANLTIQTSNNLGVLETFVEDEDFCQEISSVSEFYRQINILAEESTTRTKAVLDAKGHDIL